MGSQMGSINAALVGIPGVTLWTPQSTINQYAADIWPTMDMNMNLRLALIGHSLACDTVISAAEAQDDKGRLVDYVCVLDPVWAPKHEPTCGVFDWFRAANSFPFPQARVEGASSQMIPRTDHNSLCHEQIVIDRIVQKVEALAS